MKEIIFIGQVETDQPLSGPGQVLHNIYSNIPENYERKLINTYSAGILSKLSILLKVFGLLFKKDCVINVHTFGYMIPYLVYLVSRINKKNIYYMTLHGVTSLELKLLSNSVPSKKQLFLEKKIITKFPNIIVVSEFLKKYIKDYYTRTNNVYVIRNGISFDEDLSLCKKDDSSIKFISAGGISNIKGIIETCSLVMKLREKKMNVVLDVYGSIRSKQTFDEFNCLINEHNCAEYIRYHGIINHDDLLNLYNQSHYCISLSRFDTFNLTLLESLSQGTPIITTNKTGISEIINDDCGLVLHGKDLTDIVFNYINVSSDIYKKRQVKAREMSKNYCWENIANEYMLLFGDEKNV